MADLTQIAETLSGLTVMQAAELVKMLETKWGVSAAAPVAVAVIAMLRQQRLDIAFKISEGRFGCKRSHRHHQEGG